MRYFLILFSMIFMAQAAYAGNRFSGSGMGRTQSDAANEAIEMAWFHAKDEVWYASPGAAIGPYGALHCRAEQPVHVWADEDTTGHGRVWWQASYTLICDQNPQLRLLMACLYSYAIDVYPRYEAVTSTGLGNPNPNLFMCGAGREIGYLSTNPLPNTAVLYQCASQGGDIFSSRKKACVGEFDPPAVTAPSIPSGYIFTSPPPEIATAMLYRCRYPNMRHFYDSTDATCGGAPGYRMETLGYIVLP